MGFGLEGALYVMGEVSTLHSRSSRSPIVFIMGFSPEGGHYEILLDGLLSAWADDAQLNCSSCTCRRSRQQQLW
jgi:hypothetical protein